MLDRLLRVKHFYARLLTQSVNVSTIDQTRTSVLRARASERIVKARADQGRGGKRTNRSKDEEGTAGLLGVH